MTVVDAIVIGLGGFIGAVLRFFISIRMNNKDGIPIGTLVVNLTGSLLIGLLIGLELPKFWTIFLVSGMLGALTTFSTLMKELLQLWMDGKRKQSIFYSMWTIGVGIILAYSGFFIGQLFI